MDRSTLPPPGPDLEVYGSWRSLLRSWFWRFYDHLFHLVLINFGWFLTCFALGWLILGPGRAWTGAPSIPSLMALSMSLCLASVGWAYLVFRIFNGQSWSWSDLWKGLRRYVLKASIVAFLSGGVAFLALYSLHFYLIRPAEKGPVEILLAGSTLAVALLWAALNLFPWPLLFFQDASLFQTYRRAFFLTVVSGPRALGLLAFSVGMALFFTLVPVLWALVGFAAVFSLQCVALEKAFLRYRITYQDRPLDEFLETLDREKERGWRDILKPWENR